MISVFVSKTWTCTSLNLRWVYAHCMFTLTVASSEQDAIQKSLNGFHLMSSTLPLWPEIFGWWGSTLPVWEDTKVHHYLCIYHYRGQPWGQAMFSIYTVLFKNFGDSKILFFFNLFSKETLNWSKNDKDNVNVTKVFFISYTCCLIF